MVGRDSVYVSHFQMMLIFLCLQRRINWKTFFEYYEFLKCFPGFVNMNKNRWELIFDGNDWRVWQICCGVQLILFLGNTRGYLWEVILGVNFWGPVIERIRKGLERQ